jgi:two-component system cell cycle response regulator DivK
MMPAADILVVDDQPSNLALLQHLLALCGHQVRTAPDAASALALVAQRKPQLILLDLQLPQTDGFALARQLKSAPETADIRIIAVTAYAMAGDRDRALAAGCDDYVAKPIDTRALPGLVARHLGRA